MVITSTALLIGGLSVLSGISTATSIVALATNAKTRKKLSRSIDRIDNMSEDRITDELIRSAVARTAERKYDTYMKNVGNDIHETSEAKLKEAARDAVAKEASYTREQVASKIDIQVSALDIEDLRKAIYHRAEDRVIERLDINLDKYTRRMEDQINTLTRSYEKALRARYDHVKPSDSTFRFTLG